MSPLGSLTALVTLHVDHNQLIDISGLESLVNLEVLTLGTNEMGMEDSNNISDLGPISGLTNLRELSIVFNAVADLSPLSGLINLERLVAHYNQIVDIDATRYLVELTNLHLSRNEIVDIEPLVGNKGLGKGDHVSIHENRAKRSGALP